MLSFSDCINVAEMYVLNSEDNLQENGGVINEGDPNQ